MRAHSLHTSATRVIPVSEPNKVKKVTKLADGGMRIEFNSGKVTTLSKDDELIQAFAVWSIVAGI